MSNVLIINSSAAGDASVSNQLIARFKADYTVRNPSAVFVEHDLGRNPLAPLSAANLGGLVGHTEAEAAAQLAATSDRLIAELEAADLLVIGAPMYNFGITALLKTWFDYVLRAGRTFRYTEQGPVGLLSGKRAIVALSRGGIYSEGALAALDSQEPHLRTMLGFVGITDVTFVRAEKLAFGPDAKAAAIAAAETAISGLALAA